MTTTKKIVIGAIVAAVAGGVYLFRFKRPASGIHPWAASHPTLDPYADSDSLAGKIDIIVSNDKGDTAHGSSSWRDP
jgi:hypothetical protein